jgi:hypothetical protein
VQSTVQLKTHKVLADRSVHDNSKKKGKEIKTRKPYNAVNSLLRGGNLLQATDSGTSEDFQSIFEGLDSVACSELSQLGIILY